MKQNIFYRLFSKKGKGDTTIKRKDEPAIVSVSNDDKEMNWAIEKARLTLHYFIKSLNENTGNSRFFSAKVRIKDGQNSEHIWLTGLEFDDDGNLFGTINNVPAQLTSLKLNQKIGIANEMITDWMIVENNRLTGGYTIRAIRNKITDKYKLNKFDKEIGNIVTDEGEDYFTADFATPEGAIICIENAYDERDINNIISCKDFIAEAELMLLKNNILNVCNKEDAQKMIASLSETLELSLIKELNEKGMPDFKNCKRAFPRREKVTDLHWIITEVLYYPNGEITQQKINTYYTSDGWRVLNPE